MKHILSVCFYDSMRDFLERPVYPNIRVENEGMLTFVRVDVDIGIPLSEILDSLYRLNIPKNYKYDYDTVNICFKRGLIFPKEREEKLLRIKNVCNGVLSYIYTLTNAPLLTINDDNHEMFYISANNYITCLQNLLNVIHTFKEVYIIDEFYYKEINSLKNHESAFASAGPNSYLINQYTAPVNTRFINNSITPELLVDIYTNTPVKLVCVVPDILDIQYPIGNFDNLRLTLFSDNPRVINAQYYVPKQLKSAAKSIYEQNRRNYNSSYNELQKIKSYRNATRKESINAANMSTKNKLNRLMANNAINTAASSAYNSYKTHGYVKGSAGIQYGPSFNKFNNYSARASVYRFGKNKKQKSKKQNLKSKLA